jgi:dihydrofolate reductase
MRNVIFGVANSLDNFIARKDHSFDWILFGKEATEFMADFWKTIDTIVTGRKTYEVVAKQGMASYPGMKNYVCSRTLAKKSVKGVEFVSDAARLIRTLKKQKGKSICVMGGGELAQSLFEADLIDEIGFNIHPLLLGSGIPLYHPMKRQTDLKLLECRSFKNGCVLVRYAVVHRKK